MKRLTVAILAFAALAAAPAPTSYDDHHVHVLVPSGWTPSPAAAEAARKSMAGRSDLVADAVAWGDASAGVTGLFIAIDMKVKGDKVEVRPTLAAFVDGVFKPLPPGKRSDSESATALRARMDSTKGALELSTIATGVIDKAGTMHGYSLVCVRTGSDATRAKAAAACEALLGSFTLTWKDGELRKLEKK